MNNAVVFGGSGFLGSHVCDKLMESDYNVTVFDKNESEFIKGKHNIIIGDILSEEKVSKAVENANIVFNFAGLADINLAESDPIATVRYNILGNTIILEACRKAGIERYIFASSVYVYSNLGGFYRCSKQSCELYVENFHEIYNLNYTILRYGSLYGPRSDMSNGIYRFINQALTDKKMIFKGKADSKREFIHVEDAAESSVKILEPKYANQHIILTGNQLFSIRELLKMIKEILNDNKIQIEFTPDENDTHYEMTPYTFNPKFGKKMNPELQRDFGQGILQVIEDIYRYIHPEVKEQLGYLLEKNNKII